MSGKDFEPIGRRNKKLLGKNSLHLAAVETAMTMTMKIYLKMMILMNNISMMKTKKSKWLKKAQKRTSLGR